MIKAIQKNRIHFIAHPCRFEFLIDIEEIFKVASDNGVLLELNLVSLTRYGKSVDFMKKVQLMLELIEKNSQKVIISSDAHIATKIGDDSILNKLGLKIDPKIILGEQGGYQEIKEFLKSK
jgi:histidinol phosphatase-like PHP family hydrolase